MEGLNELKCVSCRIFTDIKNVPEILYWFINMNVPLSVVWHLFNKALTVTPHNSTNRILFFVTLTDGGKQPLGGLKRRCLNGIKMELRAIGYKFGKWKHLRTVSIGRCWYWHSCTC
jgi:hypothetical protein